jgi:hypothetical protein
VYPGGINPQVTIYLITEITVKHGMDDSTEYNKGDEEYQ